MALEAGRPVQNGIIVGSMGPMPMTGTGLGVLDEVIQALAAHHGMSGARPHTGGVWGPLGPGEASKYFTSPQSGAVLRVTRGYGALEVAFGNYQLTLGDWAFVPAGAEFRVVSTVLPGRGLWFAMARLNRR